MLREILPRNCWKNNTEGPVSGARGPGEIGGNSDDQMWPPEQASLKTSKMQLGNQPWGGL